METQMNTEDANSAEQPINESHDAPEDPGRLAIKHENAASDDCVLVIDFSD
jgi:hypothetical protein